ncbi:hypothetical protein BT63DRAFT_41540 [Microthyrium microscopicum]|uniref:Ubiquinol-cytochrome c chaperone domain-containing protein n=1 Tax=Microthyrium microscopicum TaxID=703497 RepID=A0A6A6UTU0_9PEZI|nr:hypothetical protein BT63DRAFT_41540 [Microthyrium microscopicum]
MLATGQRVGVRDEHGEVQVLAPLPDDIHNYKWTTPQWSWGVLERLFQDCERAKVTFQMEEYVDELDGKTKKRVKRDEQGMHDGLGSGWWFDALGLPKTFNTWATVCMLHMWMLKVRIRQLPKKMCDHWSDLLTNHFFWEAERTMDFVHKIDASDRRKSLEAYSQIWRGTVVAYDEGLIKGDDVLAAAVWRQLFNADANVDPLKIALVTAYVRREVARLGRIEDEVLARGYVGFGEPVSEADVLMQSPLMAAPFESGSARQTTDTPEEPKSAAENGLKGGVA